jgi:hypothetical protein
VLDDCDDCDHCTRSGSRLVCSELQLIEVSFFSHPPPQKKRGFWYKLGSNPISRGDACEVCNTPRFSVSWNY